MIKYPYITLIVLLSSCSAVEGIFKAGWWSGIIVAVIVIIFLVLIFGNKKK